jgi:DNA polymerase epsilon subunit 2
MNVTRRQVIRACSRRSWMIQPLALSSMHDFFSRQDHDCIELVLDALAQQMEPGTTLITEALWQEFVEKQDGLVDFVKPTKEASLVVLENAFESPRLTFDSTRKAFRVEVKQLSLLGTAYDKVNMLSQRYAIVHQRMMRQKDVVLTPLESLLGRQNDGQVSCLVMGILSQTNEGSYWLEDPTGSVPLSFHNASLVDPIYVTEHSILLMEGSFLGETFMVQRVGSPFLESRHKSLKVLKQQVRHPRFQPTYNPPTRDVSLMVLADVHLDQPSALSRLDALFKGLAAREKDHSELLVIGMMGNFASNPYATNHHGWEDLATLIAKYSALAKHAHFVFIPGPNDTKFGILPQASLISETVGPKQEMSSHAIQHVHWGSNPCRLNVEGKEIVFFRHDLLSSMLQNQIRLPLALDTADVSPHSRLLKTVVDQGHLLPVAKEPIYWNFDHAMRLYPLPDALFLGGSSAAEEQQAYDGCDAAHLGSFSKRGSYCTYFLGADVDGMDGPSKSRFEFSLAEEPERWKD